MDAGHFSAAEGLASGWACAVDRGTDPVPTSGLVSFIFVAVIILHSISSA